MTKQELYRLISGPISAYLMTDGCSYGKFIELLNKEFPELDLNYTEIYPLLFNLKIAEPDGFVEICYDINATGKKYLNQHVKTLKDYIENDKLETVFDETFNRR